MLLTHLALGLPSGLLPSGFPTNNLYTFLFSPNSRYDLIIAGKYMGNEMI
jgi:hypothetical protein